MLVNAIAYRKLVGDGALSLVTPVAHRSSQPHSPAREIKIIIVILISLNFPYTER